VEIRINVRLAEAPAEGLSIFDYDSHATGALAYEMLAEELLLRCRPRANVGGDLVTSP
jgi:cellulose biosynthesis protein BcsQ